MAGRNAGQRIISLISRVDQTPGNVSMIEGLKYVFDYEPKDAEREHVRRLEAWRGQIDLVRRLLRSLGFPESLYARWLDQLEGPLRPTALSQPFDHLRQNLSEAVRLCLEWCAYALEDEGGSDEHAAAQELSARLRALLESESLHALPESVKQIYSTHLQAVLDALDLAGIDGSKSLRKAAKAAAVDIIIHAEEIAEATASAVDDSKNFVRQAGASIGEAFDLAKKSGEAVDGMEKIGNLVAAQNPNAVELLGWSIDR